MAKNWTYGSILQFRSQFVNGYKSRSEQEKKHLKSKFMTPGYLDISLGITYKSPQQEIPHHGQHVSARLERHLCRKRLDPHAARFDERRQGGRHRPIPMVSRTPRRPRNTRAVRRSRSASTARSARRATCVTSRRSSPSTAGLPTSARRTRSATYTKYLEAYDKWEADEEETSVGHDIKDKPRLPIHPTVRWENTLEIKATKYLSTKRLVSSSTTTGRRTSYGADPVRMSAAWVSPILSRTSRNPDKF